MSRTLPPLKLEKSPLVLVLCQVRIAPILQMAEHMPPIQEKLRLEGYPLFQPTLLQQAIFGPAGITSQRHNRWQLQDKDASKAIVLSENFIVFQTVRYSVFDDFVKELALAVDTVAAQVKGLVIQRVGLRYVDLVRARGDETWLDFVRPGLHGPQCGVFEEQARLQFHQSVAETRHGTLVVRLIQNRDGHVLPPDLQDGGLEPQITEPIEKGELLTLLDLDHFSPRQVEYAPGYVEGQAWALHDDLDRVFREALVTERALEVWR
jgi:uncharacterized protein (TIGR04255 family)